jgi:hypothetical protein
MHVRLNAISGNHEIPEMITKEFLGKTRDSLTEMNEKRAEMSAYPDASIE